jgi:hypothetical protein
VSVVTSEQWAQAGYVGEETGVVVEWLEEGGSPEPIEHEIRWSDQEREDGTRGGLLTVTLPTGDLTRIMLPLATGIPSDVGSRWIIAHPEGMSPGDDAALLVGLGRCDHPDGYCFRIRLENPPTMLDLVTALTAHPGEPVGYDVDVYAEVFPEDGPYTGTLIVRRP